MAKEIKVALCGVRGHIDKFGRMINSYEESETIAVWDQDYDKAKEVADIVGGCAVFTDYDELLKLPELDGVVITYHNYMHKELAVKAAKAGKNIFLEKPLAPNLEDAKEIYKAIKDSGVKFFLTDPFVNGSTTYIRDFIRSGRLGELRTVRIRRSSPGNVLRDDADEEYYEFDSRVQCGGHMIDQGGHALHALHYIMGKPETVYAKLIYGNEFAEKYDYDQMAYICADYPNEVTAVIESGLISADFNTGLEVTGTKGTIMEVGGNDRSSAVRYKVLDIPDGKKFSMMELRDVTKRGEWVDVPAEDIPADPDDHIRYWIKMQAYDIPNEQVGIDPASLHGLNLDDAYELMEIIDAVYRSSKSHKAEKV